MRYALPVKLSKSKIFLFSCLSFISGIALSPLLPVYFLQKRLALLSLILLWSLLFIFLSQKRIFKLGSFALLFLLLGILRFAFSLPKDSADNIWHYNGREIKFTGVIAQPPDVRNDNTKYTIETKYACNLKNGDFGQTMPCHYQNTAGKILVTLGLHPFYNYGDLLEVVCELEKPDKINDFHYDRYLARYGIYSVCYYPHEIKVVQRNQGNFLLSKIFSLKTEIEEIIDRGLKEPEASLAAPIILGGQRGIDESLRESFSRAGLTHIMAVSGMNISFIIVIIGFLFYHLGIKRIYSFFLSSVFLILFILLVGAPASAVRAGVMGFLILYALYLGRLNKIINALTFTAAIMVLINPQILRDDIGFQLSFMAILGIIYLYPILKIWLEKITVPIPSVIIDILSVTLATQVFTLPIIASNFSQISLMAPLSNLAVLWILPFLTIAIFTALPLSYVLPALAALFFFPAFLMLKYIIFIVVLFSKMTLASIEIFYFPFGLVLLYYISISILIIKKNMARKLLIILIAFALFPLAAARAEDYNDLLVESISVSPASPAVNQTAQITVKVKNNGTRALYTSAGLNGYSYQIDNFTMTKISVNLPSYSNVVSAGGYVDFIIEGKFSSVGEMNVAFSIDTLKELVESNEDNNAFTKKITTVGENGADLKVESISLGASTLLVNDTQSLIVSVKNNGTVSLISSLGLLGEDTLMTFSGFQIESANHDNYPTISEPLDPGEIFKYTYVGRFTRAGANSLSFQIDRLNQMLETNEGNNSLTETKTVYVTQVDDDSFELASLNTQTLSSTSVAIIWSTSKEASGTVNYKDKFYETPEETIDEASASTTHKIILSNLNPDSTYYYRVVSKRGAVTHDSGYRQFVTPIKDLTTASEPEPAAAANSNTTAPSAVSANQSAADVNLSYQNITNKTLYGQLKGKIILKVESNGEAYYVNPASQTLNYLGRPNDAFKVMREQGVGITNANLAKIPLGLDNLAGSDQDKDGLPDALEDALGTKNDMADSDGDGFSDKAELSSGYSPVAKSLKLSFDSSFSSKQKGKIFLQTESRGEAWYVNPNDGKRYFLGRPADAFSLMRALGLGISNDNFSKL